jgi:hypothetical protein
MEAMKMMVLTEAKGTLDREREMKLLELFRKARETPPEGLLHAFVVHADDDDTRVKIVGIWKSMEALQAARERGLPSMRMFRELGAESELTIYDITETYMAMAPSGARM